ncbi:MAG: hydantoinase/oxoprolinase family protein [Chloroflexi bacterium]|nr:hydantoinase/oxoprolinase family protein [Chloroflexota bacterium]
MASDTRYKISVDTGGTFTDLVLANQQSVLGLYKSPTTAADMFHGIKSAMDLAAESNGLTLHDLLAATDAFVYSTTVSTNAILEGKIAKTAFFATKGHPDSLLYREGGKFQSHNLAMPFPEPYVPRSRTFEIEERILADGTVYQELDEEQVKRQIQRLHDMGVEAVGVCLLWSPVNQDHEKRVGALLKEYAPNVEVTLSHQLNPIIREYRRASATCIDASIKALMREHLTEIDSQLRELGFQGDPLMVTHMSGGVLNLEEMVVRPLHTVDSGPALAPVAGLAYAEADIDTDYSDLLVVDAGGTSFDVSLTRNGSILYTREKWLGEKWSGHMTGLPAVDTRSVGAGGGSLAYVDAGGLLQVGPESAGANPGPACYNLGGDRPTVTDAAVVLGHIDPAYFLGGRMTLDPVLAKAAIDTHVAAPLNLSTEAAAQAIITVSSERMRGFISEMTISQGLDPRESLMIAGGGSAGLTIVGIARELSVSHVLIPKLAAGLSAMGGQYSDLMATFSRGWHSTSKDFDAEGVNNALRDIANDMDDFFRRVNMEGEQVRQFICEARYVHQVWELDVSLGDKGRIEGDADLKALQDEFDRVHMELFHVNQPGHEIEMINWRGEARVRLPRPELLGSSGGDGGGAQASQRTAYFEGQALDTAIYTGASLAPGTQIDGPAIIEEPTTTIVVIPGAQVTVRPAHYLVRVGSD